MLLSQEMPCWLHPSTSQCATTSVLELLAAVLQLLGLHKCCHHEHALPLRLAAPGWGAGCAMSRAPQLLDAVCAGLLPEQTASTQQRCRPPR